MKKMETPEQAAEQVVSELAIERKLAALTAVCSISNKYGVELLEHVIGDLNRMSNEIRRELESDHSLAYKCDRVSHILVWGIANTNGNIESARSSVVEMHRAEVGLARLQSV